MIPFPVEGWHVVTIDQSIAASATYRPSARYPTDPTHGVRVSATCHGPRYDRFMEACRASDDAAIDAMTIHVYGMGRTIEAAMADAVAQAEAVEATDPM